ncbi:CHASE domain-containing protein [Tepidamorphus sp. 3E244]|uniref:CHASE domain-containing sensor histidine kinase n=1 Tax=Tepidamorphus sp. 3E244 TaxID=3385498 RepID=UPI0038FC135D
MPDSANNDTREHAGWLARIADALNPNHHPTSAWVVFAISLMITAGAWMVAEDFVQRSAEQRFAFETEDIRTAIFKRLQDQEEALIAGVGLFAASQTVTRADWRQFVKALNVDKYYTGLQGFGFSRVIQPDELADHEKAVRGEGFPMYEVRPKGERDVYTSIEFIEPFDWRNRRAFGFDMFSEPSRRAAMERARDTGEAAVTSAVTLVQETDENVQLGFLMYLPVYKRFRPLTTVEERRAALLGYVYSPFRMNDLMSGILGAGNASIDFDIYDGTSTEGGLQLYSTDSISEPDGGESQFQRTLSFAAGGHDWTLSFHAHPGYLSMAEEAQPMVIAAGGLLIDVLVFVVISTLGRRHAREFSRANRMTASFRNQAARTRAIVETAQEGIVTLNSRGLIDTLNPAALSIFGYPEDEIVGMTVGRLLTPRSRNRREGRLITAITTRDTDARITCAHVEGVRADGSVFPMEISISSMEVGGERLFTAVLRDVTERKKVEKLKNEFIAVVSHELRTPLTSLNGSLSLINSGHFGELPAKVKMMIDMAQRNGKRLAVLVDDILDIEKIEAGHMEFRFERLELGDVISTAIEECSGFAQARGVGLVFENWVKEAFVVADSARMTQVLNNLMSNALKFSPLGSVVTVAAERVGHKFRVSVKDVGSGIPKHMHERIFEKFRQADSSDGRQQEGTGLGLPVAQLIAEHHGSRIHVISDVGQGATFYFDLAEADVAALQNALELGQVA